MTKAFRKHFQKRFSRKPDYIAVIGAVLDYKSTQPIAEIREIVKALELVEKVSLSVWQNKGKHEFRELLWIEPHKICSIERELEFAGHWLTNSVGVINQFRRLVLQVENYVLQKDYEVALEVARQFRENFGWTMWSLEIEFSLLNKMKNATEIRRFSNSLSQNSKSRIAGLLAQIIKDRNDEAISIEAFMAKCENTFPKLPISEKVMKYLYYRSYGVMEIHDIPIIMGFDFSNSVVDYYETLVDSMATMATKDVSEDIRVKVGNLARLLSQRGIEDFRLDKILFLCGGGMANIRVDEQASPVDALCKFMVKGGAAEENLQEPIDGEILEKVNTLHMKGATSFKTITDLFKLGVNFRGLPFGSALANFAERSLNDLLGEGVCSSWMQFSTSSLEVEHYLGLSSDLSRRVLRLLSESPELGVACQKAREMLLSVEDDGHYPAGLGLGYEHIWIVRELIAAGQVDKAIKCLGLHHAEGTRWSVDFKKLEILAAVERHDLSHAIDIATEVVLSEPDYGFELPLKRIFEKRKWKDLSHINHMKVAIVADCSSEKNNDSNGRYFCRLACRSFYDNPRYNLTPESWKNLPRNEVHLVVKFLEKVMVEENMTMSGFQSTQEVRNERIRILQILLQLNPDSESQYAEEIKEHTFDDILWKGIRQVNETRVFVNESAIARWAEKDLAADFNRWRDVASASEESVEEIIDGFLRQYLTGSNSTALDMSLMGDKLTEADAMLLGIVNRLREKFLLDPADGLDSYLSSRIRHGTLKGTLLGAMEAEGLIGITDTDLRSGKGIIGQEIKGYARDIAFSAVKEFEKEVGDIASNLVKRDIQIRSSENPEGMLMININQANSSLISAMVSKTSVSQFSYICFDLFWQILRPSLEALSCKISVNVKRAIQTAFDKLIETFRNLGEDAYPITNKIVSISTATQAQVDVVAGWFQSDRKIDQQVFSLEEAIEIAKSVTKNVYRNFPNDVVNAQEISDNVPLTSMGLLAITDCLYVLLENVWKHSGLGPDVGMIAVKSQLDAAASTLAISVRNPLTADRARELGPERITEIRNRFSTQNRLEIANKEGGSGFAKLAKLTRRLDGEDSDSGLQVDVVDGSWVVDVSIPVYKRGEAFDAYFE